MKEEIIPPPRMTTTRFQEKSFLPRDSWGGREREEARRRETRERKRDEKERRERERRSSVIDSALLPTRGYLLAFSIERERERLERERVALGPLVE